MLEKYPSGVFYTYPTSFFQEKLQKTKTSVFYDLKTNSPDLLFNKINTPSYSVQVIPISTDILPKNDIWLSRHPPHYANPPKISFSP